MQSKISFFNKGIFFNNIKRFWLITFSYTFFLLLFVMGYLNSAIDRLEGTFDLSVLDRVGADIFGQSRDVMILFLGFYALVSGLAVFSYMQFQKNTAMVHSLPLRRETLFVTNYLSGLFLVTFPLLFNGLILIVVEAISGFSRLDYAFIWLGVNLVLTFLLYTFTVFAGMFTGHLAAQAIFFLIYNFLAFFLEYMVNIVLTDFLFGFTRTATLFDAWSPLYHIVDLFGGFAQDEGNVIVLAGYLIAGIIFLVSSYILYKKRHMEVASDVISFQSVKPIFKYTVAFCSSALLGSILVSVLDIRQQLTPYILTYLVGGLIGYFSSEMLLRKTFRVFKSYKGFVAFAIALSLLLCSISFDFYGYERLVPKDSDVELMFVSQYPDPIRKIALRPEDYDSERNRHIFNSPEFRNNAPSKLTDELIKELRMLPGIAESRESITKARLIHTYIVENETLFKENRDAAYLSNNTPKSGSPRIQSRALFFGYRLRNGNILERQYNLLDYNNNTELDQLLRDYLSIPEVRQKYEPLLQKTAKDIRSIYVSFNNKEGVYQSHEISDIQGLLSAYQEDVLSRDPLESMFNYYDGRVYNISLAFEYFKGNEFYNFTPSSSYSLNYDYVNTLNYLLESGLITQDQLKELNLQGIGK